MKECSLRLWSPFFSCLLLFPHLFPVKNVHAEWFSFGKCDLTEMRHSMVMCSFSRILKNKQTGLQAKLESCGCLDFESRRIKDKLKLSKLAWSRMHKLQSYKRNGNLWSLILNKAIFKGVEKSLLKSLGLLPLTPEWMICNNLLYPSTLPWYWYDSFSNNAVPRACVLQINCNLFIYRITKKYLIPRSACCLAFIYSGMW